MKAMSASGQLLITVIKFQSRVLRSRLTRSSHRRARECLARVRGYDFEARCEAVVKEGRTSRPGAITIGYRLVRHWVGRILPTGPRTFPCSGSTRR